MVFIEKLYKDVIYVLNPDGSLNINFGDNGVINLEKDDKRIKIKSDSDGINWEEAQGTGIREEKIIGHDVLRSEDDKLLIKDK